jgi:hypothetical protein
LRPARDFSGYRRVEARVNLHNQTGRSNIIFGNASQGFSVPCPGFAEAPKVLSMTESFEWILDEIDE